MNRRSFFQKLAGAAASVAVAASIEWKAFDVPKFRTLRENFCQAIVDIWEDQDATQWANMAKSTFVAQKALLKTNHIVWHEHP